MPQGLGVLTAYVVFLSFLPTRSVEFTQDHRDDLKKGCTLKICLVDRGKGPHLAEVPPKGSETSTRQSWPEERELMRIWWYVGAPECLDRIG
eukprot:858002-Pelagomonas_calceolata.AAC.6